MGTYASPKRQYAIWDGTNVDEIREFINGAYVETNGTLWTTAYGGTLIADHYGVYVAGTPGGYSPEWYATEADFLAEYSPIPNE